MQNVFGDAQSFVNLLACAGLDGIYASGELAVRLIGVEEVLQEENQIFIATVGIVAMGIEAFYQEGEAFGEVGFDIVEGLVEFRGWGMLRIRRGVLGAPGVFEELFFRAEYVAIDRSGEILLKKDGKTIGGAFLDPVGIVVGIVEDEELSGTDGDVASVDRVPFFAGHDRLDGEAADMVVARDRGATGVDNDIMPAELAEVGLFVKSGGAMVGQPGKIHTIQI